MSSTPLEEQNKKIQKRMLNLTDVRIIPLPRDSKWLRPLQMIYVQDNMQKKWDLALSGDSVSIIIFNISRRKLIFVKQFRPAAFFACLPNREKTKEIDLAKYPPMLGLTIELCSGVVDKDKPLVNIAQDEVQEECGYQAPTSAFQKILTYRSIGCAVSKQTLFYVEVTDEMNIHPGGGLESEGELIEIIEMSVEEVRNYINSEEVQSPASFLNGVSWFLINKKDRYV
ncbi:PREDICTED: uridine diphosphate glucose pyrophosphatase-like [Ceratosolen solmsi marchali]|uniref:Uridine diphosphate glucose pyrophosphatase NUDT14 n=1 Tax=Ceratosolen solmsi marchali TaxID=326594 RepID=A0AAJ7DTT9_9HYME|nr:PREDICTED: uridine diphosphate glucose pyrophosphatase-like [Ceratosolen solmsi marchali]